MAFEAKYDSLYAAQELDFADPLVEFRKKFIFPLSAQQEPLLYFAGHSLGLMPAAAKDYVQEELDAWASYGVEGHFHGKHPWLPYHENVTGFLARLVGAENDEVVAMNSLTVNLHLMLVSFYRPTAKKYKILIENNTFPSDKYAVDSQARFHGFDPRQAIIELKPQPGRLTLSEAEIIEQIQKHGDELALVLLGNCNYLSGQCFPFESISQEAQKFGAFVGFNLAHGAGNLDMHLHEWGVDFAVWCSYKYLNAGPGGIAGAFVHQKHLGKKDIPRFEGWWGHNKEIRFKMGPDFLPLNTAEAWQLSNPPIFQLASLRASLEIFDQVGMPRIRRKGDQLTSYLEWLLLKNCANSLEIVTPDNTFDAVHRGSMICVRLKNDPKMLLQKLKEKNVILDFREPDILRITPAPLYNSYVDVYRLSVIFAEVLS